jgi:glycosyltransferase involved in cell wall biosynthesis
MVPGKARRRWCPPLESMEGVEVLGLSAGTSRCPGGLKHFFPTSDVHRLPSRHRLFGMTYSETMFHGLLCIGPRSFMGEIIEPGRTGWLLGNDDPAEFATYLVEALEDRGRIRATHQAGRRKAQELFRWDRATGIIATRIDQHRTLQ